MSKSTYVVYGMDRSYFSRKLEAAMRWYGLDFAFEAKTMAISKRIEEAAGTRQIPVLLDPDGDHKADTTPLMMMLDESIPERRMFPEGELGVLVHVIEEWFDEWVPRTALHYRWNNPASAESALASMADQVVPGAPDEMRKMLSMGIQQWGLKACRATGVDQPHAQAHAEAEYRRVIEAADAQLGITRFLLGDRPCAVDAVVLGGLRAHFDDDPDPKALIDALPNLRRWIDQGTQWDGSGELAGFPESTGFARAVLAEAAGPYARFVVANGAAVEAGEKAFVIDIDGVEISYRARPYPEESRQMVRRRIACLPDDQRARVHTWLRDVGLALCFA